MRYFKRAAGTGPITASAIVATVGTGQQFGSGRDFAVWLELTPLNRSSGGKERLGRISNPLGTLLCNALPGSGWGQIHSKITSSRQDVPNGPNHQ
ncbi:transposase [Sulfitobacter sp.]|uniref:transposase n=1 Tax=Sulfitobacter sp. TaxID=1903071 RepID=UPI003FCEBA26